MKTFGGLSAAEKEHARRLWHGEKGRAERICPSCEQSDRTVSEAAARFCDEHFSFLCFPSKRVECRRCDVAWSVTDSSRWKHDEVGA